MVYTSPDLIYYIIQKKLGGNRVAVILFYGDENVIVLAIIQDFTFHCLTNKCANYEFLK